MKRHVKPSECDVFTPIGEYIHSKLERLTEEYLVDNISEFGAIFLIENGNDFGNFEEMGFIKSIDNYIPEYLQKIELNSIQDRTYLECCFLFSDGYGVVLIGEENFFRDKLGVVEGWV